MNQVTICVHFATVVANINRIDEFDQLTEW